MFKEIEIKGLATRRTLVEIDEETFNRLKSIFDADNWEDTYVALNELLSSDNREEFTHVTRQGVDIQPAEYKVKGGRKKKISASSKTPVEQVRVIRDAYQGKYAVVESMIGFTERRGNIKCEVFEEDKFKLMLEYWKGIDELISCDTVLYDGQVYELDEITMTEESLFIEVGKFNTNGYFERILPRLSVK